MNPKERAIILGVLAYLTVYLVAFVAIVVAFQFYEIPQTIIYLLVPFHLLATALFVYEMILALRDLRQRQFASRVEQWWWEGVIVLGNVIGLIAYCRVHGFKPRPDPEQAKRLAESAPPWYWSSKGVVVAIAAIVVFNLIFIVGAMYSWWPLSYAWTRSGTHTMTFKQYWDGRIEVTESPR